MPPRNQPFLRGTQAIFPDETGAPQTPAPRQTTTGLGSLVPPQVRDIFDRAKDAAADSANRMKGDIIGAGMDLATRFQPVDDAITTIQRAVQGSRSNRPVQQTRTTDAYDITPTQIREFLRASHRINKHRKEMEGRWPTYQRALKVLSQ